MPVEQMPTAELKLIAQQSQGGPAGDPPGAAAARESFEPGPEDPLARSIGDYRLLAVILGAVTAGAVAWTSDHESDQQSDWLIFVLVSVLLGAVAGESFGFGLSRWRELRRAHRLVMWRIGFSMVTVLVVAAALMWSAEPLFGVANGKAVTGRGVLLSAIAILGGITTAATLAAIKQIAGEPLPGPVGKQLDVLLRLRRTSSRMLNQLGVLVLLVMGVNAAAVGWGGRLPQEVVIFSGVVASLVVGVMYVPTASTLRRRGVIFVDRYFRLDRLPQSQLIAAADERVKLERMLQLDQTTFGELKAGMVVLTPVVVSLLASLIPK